MTAATNLATSRRLSQDLLIKIQAAKMEYVVEMQTKCGCALDDFDFKAFDEHMADAVSDFNYDARDKLEDAARDEESAQAFAEEMADRADYHTRVA